MLRFLSPVKFCFFCRPFKVGCFFLHIHLNTCSCLVFPFLHDIPGGHEHGRLDSQTPVLIYRGHDSVPNSSHLNCTVHVANPCKKFTTSSVILDSRIKPYRASTISNIRARDNAFRVELCDCDNELLCCLSSLGSSTDIHSGLKSLPRRRKSFFVFRCFSVGRFCPKSGNGKVFPGTVSMIYPANSSKHNISRITTNEVCGNCLSRILNTCAPALVYVKVQMQRSELKGQKLIFL